MFPPGRCLLASLFHANFPFFLTFSPFSVVFCCAFLFSLPFAFPVAFSLSCQFSVLFAFPSAFPRQLFLCFAFPSDVSIAFPCVLVFPCIWFVRSLLLSLVRFILLFLLLFYYVPISISFCIFLPSLTVTQKSLRVKGDRPNSLPGTLLDDQRDKAGRTWG